MDIEKDNMSSLLRKVVRAAAPDMLHELVAGLNIQDVQSVSDTQSMFWLLDAIHYNTRAPLQLSLECLGLAWQLLTSPTQGAFVAPPASDRNLFVCSVTFAEVQLSYRLEQAGAKGEASPAQPGVLARKYLDEGLACIERHESLATTIPTVWFLLQRLYNMVRARAAASMHGTASVVCVLLVATQTTPRELDGNGTRRTRSWLRRRPMSG